MPSTPFRTHLLVRDLSQRRFSSFTMGGDQTGVVLEEHGLLRGAVAAALGIDPEKLTHEDVGRLLTRQIGRAALAQWIGAIAKGDKFADLEALKAEATDWQKRFEKGDI